jgi:hypothetical protein
MKYQKVMGRLGGPTKVAQLLGLTNKQTVHAWKGRKRIPSRWQLRLATLDGELQPDRQAMQEATELAGYIQKRG